MRLHADQRTDKPKDAGMGAERDEENIRERMLDKTIADSFPASDPPSSLPNPGAFDSSKNDL